jgi:hypothetical protein
VRYILCALIGIGLAVVSIALVAGGVHTLVQTGTCASGGPYVIANECPEGTATEILSLMGGIFGIIIGIAIFAARGTPGLGGPTLPGTGGGTVGLTGAAIGMTFLAVAAATWYAANGPNGVVPDGGETFITVMTVVFGVIGLLAIAGVLFGIVVGRRARVPTVGDVGDTGGMGGGSLADLVRQAQEIARQQQAGGGSVTSGDDR